MVDDLDKDAGDEIDDLPESSWGSKAARAVVQVGGAIPFAGGLFSAAAGAWSERDQERINKFLHRYLEMLRAEMREKDQVFAEIVARIDLQDEKAEERIHSEEYQKLLRKGFRNWAGAESIKKQELIRNILSNAAGSDLASYDILALFLDWLHKYSELHFAVIGDIYRNRGTTRGESWARIGKGRSRDDSAEADLFRLLFHDLSVGQIIRQPKEVNAQGQFLKSKRKHVPKGQASPFHKSPFDDREPYVLTALGEQFVHYAMTEIPVKISYDSGEQSDEI